MDEVLQFSSVAEFSSRHGYHSRLEVTKDDLDRIVGKYTLPAQRESWIPCGLNRCEEPHRHGFVIRMRDGRETHCGNKCGFNHFGVRFEEVVAQAKRAEDLKAKRAVVAGLVARKTQIETRARGLVAPTLVQKALRDFRWDPALTGRRSSLPQVGVQ